MRIVVLVKEVPDTFGRRELSLESGIALRPEATAVTDEPTERALELALSYADSEPGTEVVALTMGPASARAALMRALAVGATSAVHVLDDRLAGADIAATARALAAALRKSGFDLVVAGNASTDGAGGVIPAMLAEHLGVPHATNLSSVSIDATSVTGTRVDERASLSVTATLPAVVSVTEALPPARFASFKGVMGAKKKPLDTWSLDDLEVEVPASQSIVIAVSEAPARQTGSTIVDDGTAAAQLAAYLVENGFVRSLR